MTLTLTLVLRLTAVLSVNAGMAASVLLSSRLADDISVFALMVFSIQMLALFPILRTRMLVSCPVPRFRIKSDHILQLMPTFLRSTITLCCSAVSIYLTYDVSLLVTGIECTLLAFVTFGAPAILVWAQKFKK